MSTNDDKVSVGDIQRFIQTPEGWSVFIQLVFAMNDYRLAISSDYESSSDKARALLQFEASALVVDLLNGVLSKKVSSGGE